MSSGNAISIRLPSTDLAAALSPGDATIAGSLEQVSVSGGSMQVRSYGGALNFTTSGGKQGATIRLCAGNMNVLSHAAAVIYAGSGDDMLQLSVGGQVVHAGTGSMVTWLAPAAPVTVARF